MKKTYFYIFCILLFSSCIKSTQKDLEESLWVANLDETNERPPLSKIQYIPLETNENSLIGNINKIISINNKFYILTDENVVLIFGHNGNFEEKIERIGNGPGEYIMAVDMDVDSEDNLFILNNPKKQIIKYFSPGYTDFKIINVSEYFLEFSTYNDSIYYIGDIYGSENVRSRLSQFTIENNKLERLIRNDIEIGEFLPRSPHHFFRSGNSIYYYERFSPSIFALGERGIVFHTKISSNKFPNKGTVENWIKDQQQMLNDETSIRDITAFYETENYFFGTVMSGFLPNCFLIDKNTGSSYSFNYWNDNRMQGILGAYSSNGKELVTYCLPTQKKIDSILHYSEMDDQTKKKIQEINEESNPILVVFNFE